MDEALTSLEIDIKDKRRDLIGISEELEHQARALADWRTHFRNHPMTTLALAAGAGLALAAVIPGSHRPRRARQLHVSQPSFPAAALARLDAHGQARQRWAATWDQVVDSLAGVGAAALVGLVSKYPSRFRRRVRVPPASEFRERAAAALDIRAVSDMVNGTAAGSSPGCHRRAEARRLLHTDVETPA